MAAEFKAELTALIPQMRAFARNLCGNATRADDLVQEALMKAWKARDSFIEGSNLRSWVFTILRNVFYSEQRRAWRSQPLDQEVAEATLVANEDPSEALELLALRNAMNRLPEDQKEALILIAAGGLPYEEVAEICGCAVGTIKSRVSRARKALEEILEERDVSVSDSSVSASEVIGDIMQEAADLQAGGA